MAVFLCPDFGVNTMTETNRATNRRRNRVETPGGDESKPSPPSSEQLQANAVKQIPPPADDSFIEEITEESQKGNVVHVQQGHQQKIGDTWAGMVLTKHGWATPPDKSEE